MSDVDARLAEAIEMVKAASDVGHHVECMVCVPMPDGSVKSFGHDFIAFAGTHLPTILTALAAYRAILTDKSAMRYCDDGDWRCVVCNGFLDEGHADTCTLRAALALPIFADEEKA